MWRLRTARNYRVDRLELFADRFPIWRRLRRDGGWDAGEGAIRLSLLSGEEMPACACRLTITSDLFASPITEVHIISIVVRFSPITLTAKKDDETIRQLENAGE